MDKKTQTLILLKETLPSQYENKLEAIYEQDPLFNEISDEYYEVYTKMESKDFKTLEKKEIYLETLRELKEELMDYLNNLKKEWWHKNTEGISCS